jgi:hypothetical protein
MREECRHHIPISKLKCAFYLMPCLLFGLSGPYSAFCVFVQREGLGLSNTLWILLSPISLTICTKALFSLGRKLIDPKAGLTITDEGIFNDSSPFSSHYLKWSEVESIRLTPNVIEVRALGAEGFTSVKPNGKTSKRALTKVNITTDCLQASYEQIAEALRTHQSRPIIDERPTI